MAKMRTKQVTKIGDQAVLARTGKSWRQWFAILDRSGAKKMNHRDIVNLLKKHSLIPWWQQMVAVAFEQERGLRQKYEKQNGFEISRTRTYPVSVSRLFYACQDGRARKRWLSEKIIIRKTAKNKTLRFKWHDDSQVEFAFYAVDRNKSRITVQHSKLKNLAAATRMKKFWADRLEKLKVTIKNAE